jgi:SAM-dependent methyltransferase
LSADALPFTQLARVYDAIFADVEYEDWADFVLEVLTDLEWFGASLEPENIRVLDLACGTGSSSKPYVERGFSVTGADLNEPMLEMARAKLPKVRFHRQGFLDLELTERFHLVTCVFDSLNNLTDPVDLMQTFSRVYTHLLPGGWFAFDVNTSVGVRELWDDDRFEGEVKTDDGPAHYVWTHRYDPEAGFGHITAHCQVWTDDGLREFTEQHVERGYDPPEIMPMLERAGFQAVRFLEYPDQAVPTVESPRVWGFAQKPPQG